MRGSLSVNVLRAAILMLGLLPGTTSMADTSGAKAQERKSDASPIICTMEYRPVCGTLDGQWQTFGNECTANAAGATAITPGECGTQSQQPR